MKDQASLPKPIQTQIAQYMNNSNVPLSKVQHEQVPKKSSHIKQLSLTLTLNQGTEEKNYNIFHLESAKNQCQKGIPNFLSGKKNSFQQEPHQTLRLSKPEISKENHHAKQQSEDVFKDKVCSLDTSQTLKSQKACDTKSCREFKKTLVELVDKVAEFETLIKQPNISLGKIKQCYTLQVDKRLKLLVENTIYEEIKKTSDLDRLQQLIQNTVSSESFVAKSKDQIMKNLQYKLEEQTDKIKEIKLASFKQRVKEDNLKNAFNNEVERMNFLREQECSSLEKQYKDQIQHLTVQLTISREDIEKLTRKLERLQEEFEKSQEQCLYFKLKLERKKKKMKACKDEFLEEKQKLEEDRTRLVDRIEEMKYVISELEKIHEGHKDLKIMKDLIRKLSGVILNKKNSFGLKGLTEQELLLSKYLFRVE